MAEVQRRNRRLPLGRALEPRMMFDGAAPATVAVAADATHVDPAPAKTETTAPAQTQAQTPAAAADTGMPAPGVVREVANAHEVVFIDASLQKAAALAAAAPAAAAVVLLDPNRDGVQQITDFLGSHAGLDAVHIVSHGDTGQIVLGQTVLSDATLAEHAAQLQDWGRSLATGADVMIYGCDVAQGAVGQHFVSEIATLTGADVAASTDITGSGSGHDWTLETQVGKVDTHALDFGAAGWDGDLTSADGTVYFLQGYQLKQPSSNVRNAPLTYANFTDSVSAATLDSGYFNTSSIVFTPGPGVYSGGTFQGNDITGTLTFTGSYYDTTGALHSNVTMQFSGALSRVDQPGGRVASLFFWSENYTNAAVTNSVANNGLGFMVVVPGKAGSYSAGTDYTTSANNGAVASALTDILSTQSGYSANITAGADTATLYAGASYSSSGSGVLANDSYAGTGHTLSVSDVGAGTAVPSGKVGTSVAGTYGHLTLASNGSYTYVADTATAIATGATATDTFTYRVSDGQGGTALATLTVTVKGPGPTALADTAAVAQGSSVAGTGTGVLANDTDSSGSALHVSGVAAGTAASAPSGNVGASITGTYGHLTVNSDGSYTYAADRATNTGSATALTDTFTYAVTDALNRTSYNTLTVSVTPSIPAAPTLTWSASVNCVEGDSVALGGLGVSLAGTGASLRTLTISGAPAGTTLTDGTHSHLSTGVNDVVDVSAWTLTSLAATTVNAANFTLTATATETNAYGNYSTNGTATETVTVRPQGPVPTWTATATGEEGTAIGLGALGVSIASLTGDSNSLNTLTISGAPAGTVLTDGTHSHTSTGTNDAIDVKGWTLSSLTATPANAGNFTLTATATEKDAEGDVSTSGSASEIVTVTPKAPVLTWPATASGVKATDVALGTLGASLTNLGGETNLWNSLTVAGVPNGVVLADGHGHSATSNGSTPIDISGWTLSALTVNAATAQSFTLTVTASERDAEGNTSTQATASQTVTISNAAVPVPTLTWGAAVTTTEVAAIALPAPSASVTGDSLNTLTLSGAPAGTILTDGTHSHTFSGPNDAVDISGWTLGSLSVTPVNAANFTLTATATERNASGDVSANASATGTITVIPTAPTVTWQPTAQGVVGDTIDLGALVASVTGRTGDSNALSALTVTGVPAGVVLADGHGHSVTSGGAGDVIDVSGWTLSGLTATASTTGSFTLTARAIERDVNSDTSAAATASEQVTVFAALSAPTVTAQTATSTTPTIGGTWDGVPGHVLTVTVDGRTYSVGDGALVVNGTTWTLTIPSDRPLTPGTSYGVVAHVSDSFGHGLDDVTSSELTIAPPLSAPTVTAQTATSTTPTIGGTWDGVPGHVLTVTVDGRTYSVGDGALVVNGTTWTLTIPNDRPLTPGTSYGVVARISDSLDRVADDVTSSELTIAPPLSAPTVTAQTATSATPTIGGTWDGVPGHVLTVTVDGRTYSVGDGALVVNGTTWTLTIPGDRPLTPGTSYGVVARISDGLGRVIDDVSTSELTIASPRQPDPVRTEPTPVQKPADILPPPAEPAPAPVVARDPIVLPLTAENGTTTYTAPVTPNFGESRQLSMTFAEGGPSMVTDQNLQVQVVSSSSSSSSATNNAIERQSFAINAKELGLGGNPLIRVEAGLPKWMRIDSQDAGALKVVGDRPVGDTQTYRVLVKIKRASGEEANVLVEVAPTKADTRNAGTKSPVKTAPAAEANKTAPAPAPDRRVEAEGWVDRLMAAFTQQPEAGPTAGAETATTDFIGQAAAQAQAQSAKAAELAA